MYVILCSSTDPSGLWIYQGLRQIGLAPLELVLAEWLAYGSSWEQRLDSNHSYLKITLPDGRALCSSRIRGVVNRLLAPAPGLGDFAVPSDRDYARAELQAFYLGWLQGLPGVVINRPSSVGLCGPWYHSSEWLLRASRAGLCTPVYRQTAHDAPEQSFRSLAPTDADTVRLIAFRGQVFGAQVPDAVARSCGRLAVAAATELLGIELYSNANGWSFANATPFPDLSAGGMPLVECLAEALAQGAQS